MLIREVLELTTEETIADIAKNYLSIGEKMARKALFRAGCNHIVGKPGWFLEEAADKENLHKSIYYFANEVKLEEDQFLKDAANVQTYKGLIPRKRHSFDIDVRLMKELKLKCVRDDITLYEAVEDAIRDYLKKDDAV